MTDPLAFDDVRALRMQGDLGAFIKQQMLAARQTGLHRRALVLAYPDLAAKLTEPPINHSRPEVWNGYIPPATWNQAPNNSPARPVLLALVAEAERRNAQPKGLAA